MKKHYSHTEGELAADTIIDEMFKELDEDGGGTLDCGEITALFAKNGIHMTVEQVALMFGEANRKEAETKYRKLI